MKSIILFATIVLFTGCATNNGLSIFHKDTLFENALVYTKKADIINSFETKAILNATYLNPIAKEFATADKENFIIGIYITEDEKNEQNKYINNPNFKLTLNSRVAKNIVELNTTHTMYAHVPLKNPWAKYYCLSFDANKSDTQLKLTYSHQTFGNTTLNFWKN